MKITDEAESIRQGAMLQTANPGTSEPRAEEGGLAEADSCPQTPAGSRRVRETRRGPLD